MVNPGLVLDLVERVGATAQHGTVTVPLGDGGTDRLTATVTDWCARTGNELVEVRDRVATVRRGRSPDPIAELAPDLVPGTRLWMYTNFDCNLACDYCCARSSPQTPRRALGLDRVRRLAAEAGQADVSELILTGGEPFLLPDIDDLVAACTAVLPTTLLTNGMLFRGRRLDALHRMTAKAADVHRLPGVAKERRALQPSPAGETIDLGLRDRRQAQQRRRQIGAPGDQQAARSIVL